MISFSGIHKAFGAQVLFEDLSFGVNRRERVGLVGRNGHGKTTLLRMVMGEVEPDEGEIIVPKRYRVGYLDQHLRFSQRTILAEAALGLPPAQREETWRAEKVLSGLGFTGEDMARPPEVFSGGYQVRLNLARLLVSEPDLLLLDEPTNYLDVVSIRWLSRFLRAWPAELILVTHDRSFMDEVITHTVGIHRRRARKIEGTTQKLYDQIVLEEEVYEKTRANDEKRRKEIERFIQRFRAKNTLATRVQSRIKYLEKHKPLEALERIPALDFSFRSAAFPAKVAMRVEDLSFAYDDGPTLFAGLSFEVHQHDRVCVIGQNGKGKSTLLRLLAGKLSPRHGRITGHPRLQLGHFDQTNVDTLDERRTVADEIQAAAADCLPQTARDIAGAMMFEGDDALKKVSVLSGGEKSRVMLSKLIVSPCNLLLLDEPTNHLDMDSCDSLLAAIDAFDGAVVMVTHDEMFLHTLATRFIVFDRGRVTRYDRSYRDFLQTVGWELDERLDRTASPKPARSSAPDKKALRQERARILQERSRVLAPLEARVHETEARVIELEKEAKEVTEGLTAASVAGDGPAIGTLSRRSAELSRAIDAAYDELAATTAECERAAREFDARLEALG